MNAALPYAIPKEPGRGRAIALAAAVHAALLAFLWIGVRWQNDTPIAVEAEIWSPQIREAAPLSKPQVIEAPRPVTPAAVRPTPQPVEKIVNDNKPDIALEQLKKRKAEQRKELLMEQRQEQEEAKEKTKEKERLKEKEKEKEIEKVKKKAEEKRELNDKLTQEKQQRAQQEKEQALLKKAALDKKRLHDDVEKKKLDKFQIDEMSRIQAGVSGTGGAGTAPKSQGGRADPGYVQKVGARIKSNTIFNVGDDVDGNPAVEYRVDLLPDGSIRDIRKTKPSGVAGFDEAVRRAIEKSAPFPADKSGIAPASFTMTHRPKDS